MGSDGCNTPHPRVSSATSFTFRSARLLQVLLIRLSEPRPCTRRGMGGGLESKAREGQPADRIIRLLHMIEFPLLAFHLANSELQKFHLERVGGQWAQVACRGQAVGAPTVSVSADGNQKHGRRCARDGRRED